MKGKKLALTLVMILVVATLASACGGSSAAEEERPLRFGQIAHDRGIEWVNYGVMNFEYATIALGAEPVIMDAQNDMERVLSSMEDLLVAGVDAVSVYSFSPDLDARVAQMARDAGIPIVFENAIPADHVQRDGVVVATYYDIGYAVAEFIGYRYPGSRFVFIMGQPGMNITEPYVDGINDAIAGGVNAQMVATAPTTWTAETALNATQDILQSGLEFDVIFANNEQIALGVLSALREANLEGQIPIVATGGSPLGIEMLRAGDLDATIGAPTSFMGMKAAQKLYTLVNGGTVDAITHVPLLPATIDNVDDIIPWEPGPRVIEAIGGLR